MAGRQRALSPSFLFRFGYTELGEEERAGTGDSPGCLQRLLSSAGWHARVRGWRKGQIYKRL